MRSAFLPRPCHHTSRLPQVFHQASRLVVLKAFDHDCHFFDGNLASVHLKLLFAHIRFEVVEGGWLYLVMGFPEVFHPPLVLVFLSDQKFPVLVRVVSHSLAMW